MRLIESSTTSMERTSTFRKAIGNGLDSVDIWGIVDKSEEGPPSNAHPKVKKKYERHAKKAMPIIVINLANNQFAYIRSLKGST